MKAVFSFLFLVVTFFTSNSQIVKLHGQLKVTGTALVDVKGNDVVLHGMSFGWHNWWARF
jgi:endoglucanase